MSSSESNFRSQLSGFRWASSRTDDSAPRPSYLSTVTSSLSGYVPLRSEERTNEEEAFISLSRWDRFLGFLACLAGSFICFFFSFFFVMPPILLIRPHKFALAFTAGSLLFMVGFSLLTGPIAHLKHIFSPARLPFSIAYISSLALTLYFALGPRWMIPTLAAAIVQVVTLIIYLAAYFPGGTATITYGGRMLLRGGASLLPI
ncbi:protein transport protein sft2 [Tilletia horrida]|uniref:Protein transport protein SFT2 n=1 Tax=Tilletia horrida TaxID=155126 RepID=A0AAN6JIL3_9BASI|nr:protein transport protein sft2 [Tilletia horrida]KAK0524655.1 protein transport protein sft2 [Tilletia horrida]KAK0565562.1 protein transport protein sft2 [Tilletia horrida]